MKRIDSLKAKLATFGNFLKTWGALLVALLAVGISVVSSQSLGDRYDTLDEQYEESVNLTRNRYEKLNQQYEETKAIAQRTLELAQTEPEHQQIYNRLDVLNRKIQRTQEWIYLWMSLDEDTTYFWDSLGKAERLSDEANKAWNGSNYGDADKLISEAYDFLAEIPPPPLPPSPGVTEASDVITAEGVFTQDVIAESEDGKVELTIDEGTIAKTKENEPLSYISIIEIEEPPVPPADASIIGLTYDLGPDGATFDPPITFTLAYDPDEIPEGVNEEDLVIAMWDEEASKWVVLEDITVDLATYTISASVSHFIPFGILAPISLPVPAPLAWWIWLVVGLAAGAVIGVTIWLIVRRQGEASHE